MQYNFGGGARNLGEERRAQTIIIIIVFVAARPLTPSKKQQSPPEEPMLYVPQQQRIPEAHVHTFAKVYVTPFLRTWTCGWLFGWFIPLSSSTFTDPPTQIPTFQVTICIIELNSQSGSLSRIHSHGLKLLHLSLCALKSTHPH